MSKHKHAENMLLYAQDAMETETPWERWECGLQGKHWRHLADHPSWRVDLEYRRKPSTITVNGIKVPSPVQEPLKKGDYYYAVNIHDPELYNKCCWTNLSDDTRLLKLGLIHLTKENAIAHAKAMLAWKKGGEEK